MEVIISGRGFRSQRHSRVWVRVCISITRTRLFYSHELY